MSVQDHPDVAHGQRRLHHLGGDAPGELVLVEAHALAEHQAVEVPAQPHREVADSALVLEHRLQRRQHDARPAPRPAPPSVPPSRAHSSAAGTGGQPVHDAPHHGEEQRLEGADGRREQRHQRDVRAHARVQAQMKGQKRCGMRGGGASGHRVDEAFEALEHGRRGCCRREGGTAQCARFRTAARERARSARRRASCRQA
jgi:hypothetical protein